MPSTIDQIIRVESGGNPNAKNPLSSATGPGQFLNSTWLSMMSKYRPDLTTGRSREEILSMRTDPALARSMTEAYAAENAGMLTKAGFQPTAGNTYLAHFAGPQGAVNILGANPSTPVANIMGPDAMKANPFLANMTAADLIKWADNKMGPANASLVSQVNTPTAAPNMPTAAPTAPDTTPTPNATPNPFGTQQNPSAMMAQMFASLNPQPHMLPEPPPQMLRKPFQFQPRSKGGVFS